MTARILSLVGVVAVVGVGLALGLRVPDGHPTRGAAPASGVSTTGAPSSPAPAATPTATTARADLERAVAGARARLVDAPLDPAAAITLSEALLRLTRVTGNGGLALEAEAVLTRVLKDEPLEYGARRMLAAVYLSQHRFGDAIREAERCRQMQPRDNWPNGVLGDAHLERGEYDAAFTAFDRMLAQRPDAGAYARASYARELQGDRAGALRLMQMAAEAAAPQDVEARAWYHAQAGHLLLEMGRPPDARREFRHADFLFPGHPFALEGLARVDVAEGQLEAALNRVNPLPGSPPPPAAAALAGDILAALGRPQEAERQYRLAEAGWRGDAPEPARFARFLAERGRHLDEAVRLAAGAERRDIFTDDALAWACFRTGQLDRARAASARALRTGTRDRVIRYPAAAIEHATGNAATARRLLTEALDGSPRFDLIAAPAAQTLLAVLTAAVGGPGTPETPGRPDVPRMARR